MKLFSKKKKDEQIESNVFEIAFKNTKAEEKKTTVHAPHALTSDELLGKDEKPVVNNGSTGALDELKKRLSAISLEDTISDIEQPKSEENKTAEIKETTTEKKTEVKENPSLLDKCKPYIVNDDGSESVLDPEPLYKLQSVADILKSDSEKFLSDLSKKYDVTYDSPLPQTEKENISVTPTETNPQQPKSEEFEDKIPVKKAEDKPTKVISDIDFTGSIPNVSKPEITFNPEATVTFTPVSKGDSSQTQIKVSTHTKAIDLTNELVPIPSQSSEQGDEEIHLEQNDFEDYIPETEYTNTKDIKRLRRQFSISKRNKFLKAVATFFLTFILAFAKLPFMTNVLLSHTFASMIACSSIAGIIILLNMDMFLSLAKLFTKKSSADTAAALSSIFTVAYAVMGIIKEEVIIDVLLLLAIILSFRSICEFFKSSYMLSNFIKITSLGQKKAVRLINDPAITFSMAKNAIEGEVLISAAQKTEQISDYMKFSTYGSFLGGRMPIITILSVIVSIISGFAGAAYFDGIFYGIYAATAIQLLTSIPVVFLIDVLPLYRASKKLNRIGAALMGKMGAEQLEMANAVVLSSNDLFPNGTVTLHRMEVLSENDLDDTLIRAASLTEYMSSTLAPIFKQITDNANINILPDTDTVKYEDRMGISGWVDNRLLFIGNRTLMEAHGIEVPSLEVDRKILRSGYFPVYVATGDKACALLMIQYSVEPKISAELRTLTKIGVTLLINNTDPNLSEPMICDYLGLYEDSVKVMSAAGCHMYKNAVSPVASVSAPAAYKGSSLALAAIMNCATKIKRSNTLFTVLYILASVLGAMVFAYTSFGGSGSLLSGAALLIYGLASTVISYIIYLTERP